MENLTKEDQKGIIQKNLEEIGATNFGYMKDTFVVKLSGDIKKFEIDFMRNLPNATYSYLESQGKNPKQYNRSITYSVIDKNQDVTISF